MFEFLLAFLWFMQGQKYTYKLKYIHSPPLSGQILLTKLHLNKRPSIPALKNYERDTAKT